MSRVFFVDRDSGRHIFPMPPRRWLMKSEPYVYEGVRNFVRPVPTSLPVS